MHYSSKTIYYVSWRVFYELCHLFMNFCVYIFPLFSFNVQSGTFERYIKFSSILLYSMQMSFIC